ncbi:M48 family metallopeptidase [Desulfonatronovibrio magnus]|uniref:M48 family metallopeptidase n=1 Tax=Desulfonatronovibrio magnus TaxID=698827 RepID=UPI0005EB54F8|nr:M48 family metallopeptidase [Desulfonatronovibrio magnus]
METFIIILILFLILAKLAWETFLTLLNMAEVRKRSASPSQQILEVMDRDTYQKSTQYTIAKEKLGLVSGFYDTAILLLVLFSGALPWFYAFFSIPGADFYVLYESAYIITAIIIMSVFGIPLDYYARFNLEERFGFNKSTIKLWITDKLKGLVIGLILGILIISLIILFISRLGEYWWIWAFMALFAFQVVMMILYPMIILPWFNKLTPLEDNELKTRLMDLAQRTGFKARSIQVMDGSKRSGHSNAFFTGIGRFRRIVLFDTLIEQMTHDELEAVLAHEIGHYKKGHVPKMLALSAGMSLAGLWVLNLLLNAPFFIQAFGFDPDHAGPGPALLLFGLLSGLFTFWLSPLFSMLSRKHEYESDRFAREHTGSEPMSQALLKLSEKNLSNLTPHPLYSGFYYSHPTLFERIKALQSG